MKILQFGKFYPPHWGGMEAVIFELTEHLNRVGIKCDVLCSNDHNKTIHEKRNQYSIIRAATIKKIAGTAISARLIIELWKVRRNYDIIHLHHPDPMATIAILLVPSKAKLVIHWHSDIIRQKFLFIFFRLFQCIMLLKSDLIITTSEDYKNGSPYLRRFHHKVRVVPIGISYTRLKIQKDILKNLKENYQGKKMIFSLGRLTDYKGFPYLINAAKYLPDDYVIVIAGTDTDNGSLDKYIIPLNLNGKIQVLGRLSPEQIGAYYTRADVFCLSSIQKNEAFGIVQVESLFYGTPVVSTRIPGSGVSWVNQDGQTGFTVPIKDSKALAEAILKITNDRDLYRRFSENARKRYQNLFTSEKMVKKIIYHYEGLLKKDFK